MDNLDNRKIEVHPWEPFIPENAKYLIMGTFPPAEKRWSMDFYYPNPINDFWRVMGLIYCNDANALWLPDQRTFDLDAIKTLLSAHGIAMNDTVRQAIRLRDNASDKYLHVVQPVPLAELLGNISQCHTVATTGQKAAEIIAEITGTNVPKMGESVHCEFAGRDIDIWRLPSTSRAYPMKLADKAAYYARMLGYDK